MKGAEFKAMRESLGLTQDELAEVLCLSGKQAVSNIETGFRNPSPLAFVLLKLLSDLPKKKSQELRVQLLRIVNLAKRSRARL